MRVSLEEGGGADLPNPYNIKGCEKPYKNKVKNQPFLAIFVKKRLDVAKFKNVLKLPPHLCKKHSMKVLSKSDHFFHVLLRISHCKPF